MAYDQIKESIKAVIKENGNYDITGNVLQAVLLSMVDTLGPEYQFLGIATKSTVPVVVEGNSFYITTEVGTYTNFKNSGNTTITVNQLGILTSTNGKAWNFTPIFIGVSKGGGEVFNDYVNNTAGGNNSHAEGAKTNAKGDNSHAEGKGGTATGTNSHVEGLETNTEGANSHAEGQLTNASGENSHAEGQETAAVGNNSHAEGFQTHANKDNSHAEGRVTVADGVASHAEGSETQASGDYSHAEGQKTVASGLDSHTEGYNTKAKNGNAHAEGNSTVASGFNSHAEGYQSEALGMNSHAEGLLTNASGENSHAEGHQTEAVGNKSHAEGFQTHANKENSHAEGRITVADGEASHAEGDETQASGKWSHAEGYMSLSEGIASHAEGQYTTASGDYSHAEGTSTRALYINAHAEGLDTTAGAANAHAEGQGTVTSEVGGHVAGLYNAEVANGLFNFGIGSSNDKRKSAMIITKEGKVYFIDAGGYDGGTSIANAKSIQDILKDSGGVEIEQLDESFDFNKNAQFDVFNNIEDGLHIYVGTYSAQNTQIARMLRITQYTEAGGTKVQYFEYQEEVGYTSCSFINASVIRTESEGSWSWAQRAYELRMYMQAIPTNNDALSDSDKVILNRLIALVLYRYAITCFFYFNYTSELVPMTLARTNLQQQQVLEFTGIATGRKVISLKATRTNVGGSINYSNWSVTTVFLDQIKEIDDKLSTQLPAIEEAKNEALNDIKENEQSAITNFNSQKVTPEMLAESTKQLIEASGGGTITNLADDEDITSVDDGTGSNVLKFADRVYNADNFSGKGYKILRKNIVGGKNVLTQDMINEENTVYEIRYDFDLNEKEIVILNGCILIFNGGSLKNGTLNGNNTKLDSNNDSIIFYNIEFKGIFYNIKTSWIGDIINNDSLSSFIIIDVTNDITINYVKNGNCNNKDLIIHGNNHTINVISDKLGSELAYLFTIYKNLLVDNVTINHEITYDNYIEERKCIFYKDKADGGRTIFNNVKYNGYACFNKYYVSETGIGNIYINNCDFYSKSDFCIEYLYRGFTNFGICQDKVIISNTSFNLDRSNKNSYIGPISIQSSINNLIFDNCSIKCDNSNGNIECISLNTLFNNVRFYNCFANSIDNVSKTYINTSPKITLKNCLLECNSNINLNSYKIFDYSNIEIINCIINNNMQIDIDTFENILFSNTIFNAQGSYQYINLRNIKKSNKINIYNCIFESRTTTINITDSNNNDIDLESKITVSNITLLNGSNFITSANYTGFTNIRNIINLDKNKRNNLYYTKENGWTIGDRSIDNKGESINRPLNIDIGFQYFDTTLKKPIWWTGTKWVDSTGASV